MIDAQVTGDTLEIVITEGDASLLTSRSDPWTLSVPVTQIERARAAKPIGFGSRRHIMDTRGGLLVCARRGAQNLEIDLYGPPFSRITLSVPDPDATAAEIKGKLRMLGR